MEARHQHGMNTTRRSVVNTKGDAIGTAKPGDRSRIDRRWLGLTYQDTILTGRAEHIPSDKVCYTIWSIVTFDSGKAVDNIPHIPAAN